MQFFKGRIQKAMSLYKRIKNNEILEKVEYRFNRETSKLSALSGKINKYEYLTGEEILPSDQSRIAEQANFSYSLLGKALEK